MSYDCSIDWFFKTNIGINARGETMGIPSKLHQKRRRCIGFRSFANCCILGSTLSSLKKVPGKSTLTSVLALVAISAPLVRDELLVLVSFPSMFARISRLVCFDSGGTDFKLHSSIGIRLRALFPKSVRYFFHPLSARSQFVHV